MKIIDKYLMRQFLVPLFYCLFAFSIVLVVWDLFDNLSDIIKAKPPVMIIARYYICVLAGALEYLLPGCILLSILYALWYMTKHSELVAMRASGLGLIRIMIPFMCAGFVLSVVATVAKDTFAPDAAMWAKEFSDNKFEPVRTRIATDVLYYNTNSRRLWHVDEFDVKNPSVLKGIAIRQERADFSTEATIKADRAMWLDGRWWFVNYQFEKHDTAGNPIRTTPAPKTAVPVLRENKRLTERPGDIANERRPSEYWTTRDFLRHMRLSTFTGQERAMRATMHSRLALPWACLVVILFGVPAGAGTARHSTLSGIFISIGCFVAYYFLFQIGILTGTSGILWPWLGAWLSNIVFGVAGLVMLVRMN